MPRGIQTHIAFYVKNLEETVDKWKQLLAILDPEMVKQEPAYQVAGEGDDQTRVATFVNPNGLELQFVCPKRFADDPNSVDRVDHIHFATTDVEGKFKEVREAGFRTNGYALDDPTPTETIIHSEGIIQDLDWQKWFLVPMPGNVCAEVALPYRPVDGRWEPIENFSADERYGAAE